MTISSGLSDSKWWFSRAMLNYQRVSSHQIPINHHFPMVFLWFSYVSHYNPCFSRGKTLRSRLKRLCRPGTEKPASRHASCLRRCGAVWSKPCITYQTWTAGRYSGKFGSGNNLIPTFWWCDLKWSRPQVCPATLCGNMAGMEGSAGTGCAQFQSAALSIVFHNIRRDATISV